MKTRILSLAFAALCSLLFSSNAAAQGCQVSPNYSNYTSWSLDSNMYIYQSVTTDGYASMSATNYCHLNGVTHTPSVVNKLTEPNGAVHGGTYTGASGCPSCYISEQNTLDIVGVPGIVYTGDSGGSVRCSVVGTFWGANSSSFIHIGISNYILENWDSANCYYMIFCPNGINAASCPTPVTITDLGGMLLTTPCNTYNYLHDYKLVVNSQCFPVGVFFYANFPMDCQ